MMSDTEDAQRIRALFRGRPVMPMSDLERTLAPRSARSLFRDLSALGYLSSYTHTGRYYTLASIPVFDADGLWRFEGVCFSRDGTLKATVQRMVVTCEAGRTQRELQLRLGVRVHNPLLDLVRDGKLGREVIEREFVYVAADRKRAARQVECRRALAVMGATATPEPALEVEVLLEIIHGAGVALPDAATLVARLGVRGIRANVADVTAVLARHGLKKTPPSRSRRSKR